MGSLTKTWFKNQLCLTEAVTPDRVDVTELWNAMCESWNEDFDYLANFFVSGSQLKLTPVESGKHIYIPLKINMPFFGDFDLYDLVFGYFWYKHLPNLHLHGYPVLNGLFAYFVLRNTRVPFFGNDQIMQVPQTGNATKFGGLTVGFTFKDISYDIVRIWLVGQGVKVLGPRLANALMVLLNLASNYYKPKISWVIDRIKPVGADRKPDDDTELTIREELNYVVNYVKRTMLYLLDPFHNGIPVDLDDDTLKEEPDIGV